MHKFGYAKPPTLGEAASLLKSEPEAKLLAGGMSLLPVMKLRLSDPPALVDLSAVENLSSISSDQNMVSLGAMTRHCDVAASSVVQEKIPALAALAKGIGDVQVRHRGTIGGSVANSDPAADYPAGVLGLGASIVTDRRTIAADDFFKGLFETALQPGEIITRFDFPIPRRAAYLKFANMASRFAIVGLLMARTGAGVRIAVTGVGTHAFRITHFEEALNRDFSSSAIAGLSVSPDGVNSDVHAPAEYRAHLIGVLAARAVEELQ